MPQAFYRIVKSDPPTEDDFTSNFAKGKPPRGAEIRDPGKHRSLSAFGQREDALRRQRTFPALGSHLAEIELADDDPDVTVYEAPTNPRMGSHYSLQGEPASFLRRVRRVFRA